MAKKALRPWSVESPEEDLKKQLGTVEDERVLVSLHSPSPRSDYSIRPFLLGILLDLGEEDREAFKRKLNRFPLEEGFRNIPKEFLDEVKPSRLRDMLLRFYGEDYGLEVTAEVLRAIGCQPQADRLLRLIRKAWFPLIHLRKILGTLKELDLKKFKGELHKVPYSLSFSNIYKDMPEELLETANVWKLSDLLLHYHNEDYAVEVTAKVLKAIDCKPQADRLLFVTRRAWFPRVLLWNTLENLTDSDLKKFKDELHKFPIWEGFRNISKELLEKANVWELRDLLIEYYYEDYATVTAKVLKAIDCKPQADRLLFLIRRAQFPHVHLGDILTFMEKSDLKKFKAELHKFPVQKGFKNIPKQLLEEANVWQLRDLLISYYSEDYALEVTAEVLKAIDCKQDADELLFYFWQEWWSPHGRLLATLEDLGKTDLKNFKGKLHELPVKDGFVNIPKTLLKKANIWELRDLLISYYSEDYAMKVMAEVLKAIDCKPQADMLIFFTRQGAVQLSSNYERHVFERQPAQFVSSKITEGLEKVISSGRPTRGSLEGITISGDEMIHKGRKELTEILQEDLEFFLHVLHSHCIITMSEYKDLFRMEKGSKMKIQKLLSMIQERGEQACYRLLECVEMMYPGSIQILLFAMHGLGQNPVHSGHSVLRSKSLLSAEERRSQKIENPVDSGGSVRCSRCPSEDLPEKISPEVVWDSERGQETYRLCPTEAGSFLCSYTDLIFEVSGAVTITYHFGSWLKHLSGWDTWKFLVAGPLLNIQAAPEEAVSAVHFPHFLCLAGEDSSRVHITHFVEGRMNLEKPDRVGPYHAVLRYPRFSPRGVIFKKPWFKLKRKVHAVALLYQVLQISTPKFHLYLLPNDSSLIKAVEEHEAKCLSQRLEKPPGTLKPLTVGSRFFVQTLDGVRICPKELKFQRLHADQLQQYIELYARHMQDELELSLMEKSKDELVWEASIARDELNSSHPTQGASGCIQTRAPSINTASGKYEACPPFSPELHFIDQHREELIRRTTDVEGVLDLLLGTTINEEQYQKISSKGTNPEKMRELYRLVPSWNNTGKDWLYKALKAKHKFLVADLEER
ncbi:uncharacterized protein LOC133365896 isoform X2 [Rhineura floridana]|uniref:uncharacterized protein LOC133365896 isoform X2 n=1 Tax=Rhineura floridana TaxID=261503 RepID=UPI002AC849DF|nr:uncharacterized protein LOC133365896 isoform X2 [Rhineura floridana]